ncbi:MAG: Asp-tRNA(Asn)/Glu-tRNA(Gln) amidotransferase subunit GatC [Candidatus Paceibacterota bacterium]|jgi:aspartyl-tRNA(Asn)/glutamyl-tRNA(Gln) amidotransferase subunit C
MLKLEEIEKLAKLARLEIPAEEKEILRKEVGEILEYVGQIQQLSPKEPPKEAGVVRNVFREDKEPHQTSEFTDALLANVPEKENGYIKVKKIL